MILKYTLLSILILSSGACANYGSSSEDPGQYTEVIVESGGDPNFPGAFNIIQSQCASCHQHSSWNNLTTNELWISSGYVIQGQATTSAIITKTYKNGTGNMPPANNLSQSDFDALKNWINNIP